VSCFFARSLAFGDLSPIVVTPSRLEAIIVRHSRPRVQWQLPQDGPHAARLSGRNATAVCRSRRRDSRWRGRHSRHRCRSPEGRVVGVPTATEVCATLAMLLHCRGVRFASALATSRGAWRPAEPVLESLLEISMSLARSPSALNGGYSRAGFAFAVRKTHHAARQRWAASYGIRMVLRPWYQRSQRCSAQVTDAASPHGVSPSPRGTLVAHLPSCHAI